MTKTRFTTPVMRLVQGSVDQAQTTDMQGNPRVVKSGPNAGQPNPQYFIAAAIQKTDPNWPAFWAQIVNQAVADFPAMFPQGAAQIIAAGGPDQYGRPPAGTCLHPQFSFKMADGDGYDQNGKSNAEKAGMPGHWVVRFSSGYAPRCYHVGKYGPADQIQETNVIRRGYFVRVSGSMEGNGDQQRPGLYMNLDMVELTAYGEEIISGPDAGDAFGAAPPALPQGATATPQGPANNPPPPSPASAGNAAGHPATPPAASAPAAPVTPPATTAAAPPVVPANPAAPTAPPYDGFMQAAAPPAAPAAPVAPTPPPSPIASPAKQMTAAANGATYESMIAAGWTDELLLAHGMMAAG